MANIGLEAPQRFSSVKAAIASMTFPDPFQPISRMIYTGLVEQPHDPEGKLLGDLIILQLLARQVEWAFPRSAKSSCPLITDRV